ncbi:hypothetical protein FS749_015770 [Ceratobasidium sp. UAMH 11750]|nr:hypothetical protein FS749_015770 [Ceratobasidium sp. UAMH 11750]
MSDCLPASTRLPSRASYHPTTVTNPQNDLYGTIPNPDSGWYGYPQADALAAEAMVPHNVTGGANNDAYAGYGQVVMNGFAPSEVAPGSLPPPPVHPSEFDSQFPHGTISLPPLVDGDSAALPFDKFLNDEAVINLPDAPLSSDEINATIAMYKSICGEPQQPEASLQNYSACQSVVPVGHGDQSLGYTPNYNTTVLAPQPLGSHYGPVGYETPVAPVHSTMPQSLPSAIPAESFDVQGFKNDVVNHHYASGSVNTGWNAHPHIASPIVNHQHDQAIQPTMPYYSIEQPAWPAPIRRPHARAARLRALGPYTTDRVPATVETNGSGGPLQSRLSGSWPAPAPRVPQSNAPPMPTNTPPMPVNTLPEPADAQPPTVHSPSLAPLPTPPPDVPEPAAPALTPFKRFGHLPKGQWDFFQTSRALLDTLVAKKPGRKQLLCCQYIDPATRMRCYQTKCNAIGTPHTGKGFPVEGLEDYIRHLWLHRQLERQIRVQKAENNALLTSWADDVLDAQKALDDASGVEYPYNP